MLFRTVPNVTDWMTSNTTTTTTTTATTNIIDFERCKSQLFSNRLKSPRANPTRTVLRKHNYDDTLTQTRDAKEQLSLQSAASMAQHKRSRVEIITKQNHRHRYTPYAFHMVQGDHSAIRNRIKNRIYFEFY